MTELTHLDGEGNARMVDVSAKDVTARHASARAVITLTPEAARAVAAGNAPKGDVIGVARIAGIQAAKRTHELIPLCHQLPLSHIGIDASIDVERGAIELIAQTRTTAQTGVEMEALTAVSVAALTVYDMVKAIARGAAIGPIELVEKSGGRSGHWVRPT